MKITIDTNPLVRAIVRDDQQQALIAQRAIRRATSVAITLPCFCELIWVLRTAYHFSRTDLVRVVEELQEVPNAVADWPAVAAGLTMLRAGGDFADGVIAFEGRRTGNDSFVSYDKKAVARLHAQGFSAELL